MFLLQNVKRLFFFKIEKNRVRKTTVKKKKIINRSNVFRLVDFT